MWEHSIKGQYGSCKKYERVSELTLILKGHLGSTWAERHAALDQQTAGDSSGDDITPCVTCSGIASPRDRST